MFMAAKPLKRWMVGGATTHFDDTTEASGTMPSLVVSPLQHEAHCLAAPLAGR